MFAIGIMLFEICTQTPIENRRTWGTKGSSETVEDASIVRSCLIAERENWLDCFAESINACFEFYSDLDLDLKDAATHRQVVNDVLFPFLRDLKW